MATSVLRTWAAITMSDEPLSDLKVREHSLSNVRDALAALQHVPAAALDETKHETISGMVDDASALERSLSNEVEQMRGDPDEYE